MVKNRGIFYAVIPADEVGKMMQRRGDKIIISNLDSSDKTGSHWILILDLSDYEGRSSRCVEVFDSFGRSYRQFGLYIKCLNNVNIKENCIIYQPNSSVRCRSYVLFVI